MIIRRKVFARGCMRKHYNKENEEAELARMPLPPADIAPNDCGLPAPTLSGRARMAEAWCKHGSWQICEGCGSVRPRPLQAVDLRSVRQPTVKRCLLCRRGVHVPQPGDIPEALRNLSDEVLEALRPVEVDSGRYERAEHGYRVHTTMVRFAWAAESVGAKMRALETREQRRQARRAFKFLAESDDSAYGHFLDKHEEFLKKHPGASEQARKRPLRFIEEQGLECAVWPHLYWHRNLCETVVRATDERRRIRTGLSDEEASEEDNEAEDGPALCKGRHSVRRSWMTKIFSPVVGYSEDFQLLHFVYDLVLWSTLGGCKNATRGMPLRLAVKGSPIFPEYWRVRHQGLIDMQRQAGAPALFRTRAPYERSFPYHQWVLHEMALAGRGRLNLAGPETLHMAHVLKEMDRGFFAGKNHKGWRGHLLGAEDEVEGERPNTVVNFCSRLEFQDGKRKPKGQQYHGRGTVHSHSLDFLENKAAIKLETKIAAVEPLEEEPLLRGIVLDSQQDRARSQVAIREEPSVWDDDAGRVRLQHTERDWRKHIRAYFRESMEVTKCHEDVQMADGRNNLLRYVATYAPKFSGSFAKDWLNDDASDYSVARRVAFDYHPLEPEMWLTLAGQLFPQISYGGTLKPIVAPFAGMEVKPDYVELYEDSDWRGEEMNLLDFLRKSNDQGAIVQYLKKAHAARAAPGQSLQEFARAYRPRGEKLIAASTVSRLRDLYYGQWMALHIPFRRLGDLLPEDIVARVPNQHKFFACALALGSEYWSDEARIRKDMELEAYGDDHIATVLAWIRAQRRLVERYLGGELEAIDSGDEGARPDDLRRRMTLDPCQLRLKAQIDRIVQRSLDARDAVDDESYDATVRAAENSKIVAALGAPGSGKTAAVHACIDHWKQRGARILLALPTGQLAAEMRARHPDVDVDTCHGAFLFHRDINEALPIMTQYDLVVVDELSMLTAEHMDRLDAMWRTADQLPCLVMLGDFWQLPGPQKDPTKISDSAAWQHVKILEFTGNHRCEDPKLAKKLAALRTSVPSQRLLSKIANRAHRAWTAEEPTAWDILELDRRTGGKTTIVTCSRRAAQQVNELSVDVFFKQRHKKPLAELPTDWETNPDNFNRHGQLKKDGRPQPTQLEIFKGQRLFLTKNMNKETGFVNGMACTVDAYDARSGCLEVITKTGARLAVSAIHEHVENKGRVKYYPIRLGYASTVHRVQGQTLAHVTVWLDVACCKAAAYVAMSRVKRDCDYLIAGPVCPRHFTPAM